MQGLAADAPPLRLLDGLTGAGDLRPLDGWLAAVRETVEPLLDGDVLAAPAAVAQANDALTRRLLELVVAELGPAPGPWAWLALGSQGRGEQLLSSDQDSALAVSVPGTWSDALAERVVSGLERAGLPRCPGGFTATGWTLTEQQLHDLFVGWVDRPDPEALVRVEVFLDVHPLAGELDVSRLPDLLVVGAQHGPFRAQLARAAVQRRPPLRLGRLHARGGLLDVKLGGTAAVVLLARLHALVAGSAARTTPDRLAAAAGHGTLGAATAVALLDAYRLLMGLRLRAQVQQLADGVRPDSVLRVDALTRDERTAVRDALRLVRDVQDDTALQFATHTVL